MDPLSDVLRAVRLTGAFFYLVEAATPWSVFPEPARELTPRFSPTRSTSSHTTCWCREPVGRA